MSGTAGWISQSMAPWDCIGPCFLDLVAAATATRALLNYTPVGAAQSASAQA
jgi:hypothetical protein